MPRTEAFDTTAFKTGLEQEWRDAAPGWRRWHDPMEADDGSGAVSRLLVNRARLTPGDAVLDVGAGYGEPALTAARAVAPGGRVVLQDLSGEMLSVARERLARAGLDDVEVAAHEGDAEQLDLPPASFDALVSRAAIMYFVDVVGTLVRLRSLLRAGGGWPPVSGADRIGWASRPRGRSSSTPSICHLRRPSAPAPSPSVTGSGWPASSRRPGSPRWRPERSPRCGSSPHGRRPPTSSRTLHRR